MILLLQLRSSVVKRRWHVAPGMRAQETLQQSLRDAAHERYYSLFK